MKFSAILASLVGCAIANPIPEAEEIEARDLEKRQAINYVQNYNGGQANFQYNEGTHHFLFHITLFPEICGNLLPINI